ncbi:MAG: hypothetical protein LBT20_01875, partial [Clostridiales bacterium]|nr:hypothetical protein [Clostridiales bacterium]
MNTQLNLQNAAERSETLPELLSQIEEHNRLYYEQDAPTLSDFEYDALVQRFKSLGGVLPDRVGGDASAKFSAVTHEVPLDSLRDVFSEAELLSAIEFGDSAQAELTQNELTIEPKVDGLSVALTYVDGRLVQGATRGNGATGEDVTENLRQIADIPKQLLLPPGGYDLPQKLIIRGEVYMPKQVFEELNAERGSYFQAH